MEEFLTFESGFETKIQKHSKADGIGICLHLWNDYIIAEI